MCKTIASVGLGGGIATCKAVAGYIFVEKLQDFRIKRTIMIRLVIWAIGAAADRCTVAICFLY